MQIGKTLVAGLAALTVAGGAMAISTPSLMAKPGAHAGHSGGGGGVHYRGGGGGRYRGGGGWGGWGWGAVPFVYGLGDYKAPTAEAAPGCITRLS